MRVAIFCWRPYHVYSAINIVKNNLENTRGNTTLFLYDYANLVQLKNEIENSGLFNEVVIIKDYKPHGQYLQKMVGLFFPQKALKYHVEPYIASDSKHYYNKVGAFDKIITTSCNIILFHFIRLNNKAQIILFEDGTLSYVSNEFDHAINLHYKRIKWLLRNIIRSNSIIAKYVYEPQLVFANGYVLKKLPMIDHDTDECQRTIFSYDSQKSQRVYARKRIIYLDERYPNDYFKDDIKESDVFDILESFKDEVILRPHPGNEPGTRVFDVDSNMQSWELTCKDVLTEDSILITKTSTAAFTPFLLHGIKVNIIFLAPLLFKKTEGEERIAMEMSNKLGYKNLFMPTTFDEFRHILNQLN